MSAAEPRVFRKDELEQALAALATLAREFRALLEHAWDEEGPGPEQRRLLEGHRALATAEGGPFAALGAVEGLLHFVVAHLREDTVTFRLPAASVAPAPNGDASAGDGRPDADGIGALTRHLGALVPYLDALAGRVYTEARAADGTQTLPVQRVQRVLAPIAALVKAIVRQDWADTELAMAHLNMVTTSRDNRELVDQVGRLVRVIYDSLNEISRSVPVDALSSVSEEIPDAVQKLNSIIAELEAGANRNLDLLEALNEQVRRSLALLSAARTALAECDRELEALAEATPDAGAGLTELRDALSDGAAGPLATLEARIEEAQALYMTLFANQSYQDLTGQTLKKVIAFIESLQYQLIRVISTESGKPTVPPLPETQPLATELGPDARNRLSQERVDAVLAELGF